MTYFKEDFSQIHSSSNSRALALSDSSWTDSLILLWNKAMSKSKKNYRDTKVIEGLERGKHSGTLVFCHLQDLKVPSSNHDKD